MGPGKGGAGAWLPHYHMTRGPHMRPAAAVLSWQHSRHLMLAAQGEATVVSAVMPLPRTAPVPLYPLTYYAPLNPLTHEACVQVLPYPAGKAAVLQLPSLNPPHP